MILVPGSEPPAADPPKETSEQLQTRLHQAHIRVANTLDAQKLTESEAITVLVAIMANWVMDAGDFQVRAARYGECAAKLQQTVMFLEEMERRQKGPKIIVPTALLTPTK